MSGYAGEPPQTVAGTTVAATADITDAGSPSGASVPSETQMEGTPQTEESLVSSSSASSTPSSYSTAPPEATPSVVIQDRSPGPGDVALSSASSAGGLTSESSADDVATCQIAAGVAGCVDAPATGEENVEVEPETEAAAVVVEAIATPGGAAAGVGGASEGVMPEEYETTSSEGPRSDVGVCAKSAYDDGVSDSGIGGTSSGSAVGVVGGRGNGLGEAGQKARRDILDALMPAAACLVDDPAAEVRGTAAVSLGEMLRLMVGFEDYVTALGAARVGGAGGGGGGEASSGDGGGGGAASGEGSGGSGGGGGPTVATDATGEVGGGSMATCCCVTGEDGDFGGRSGGRVGTIRRRVCHGKVLQASMAAAAATADAYAEAAMAAELMDLEGFESLVGEENTVYDQENVHQEDEEGGEQERERDGGRDGREEVLLTARVPFANPQHDGEHGGSSKDHNSEGDIFNREVEQGGPHEQPAETGVVCVHGDSSDNQEVGRISGGGGAGGEAGIEVVAGGEPRLGSTVHARGGTQQNTLSSHAVDHESGIAVEAAVVGLAPEKVSDAAAAAAVAATSYTDGGQRRGPDADHEPEVSGKTTNGLQPKHLQDPDGNNVARGQSQQTQQPGGLSATLPENKGGVSYDVAPSGDDGSGPCEGSGSRSISSKQNDGDFYDRNEGGDMDGDADADRLSNSGSLDAVYGESSSSEPLLSPLTDDSNKHLGLIDGDIDDDVTGNPDDIAAAAAAAANGDGHDDPLILLVTRLLNDTDAYVACTMLQALRPAWVPELGPGPSPSLSPRPKIVPTERVCASRGTGAGSESVATAATATATATSLNNAESPSPVVTGGVSSAGVEDVYDERLELQQVEGGGGQGDGGKGGVAPRRSCMLTPAQVRCVAQRSVTWLCVLIRYR